MIITFIFIISTKFSEKLLRIYELKLSGYKEIDIKKGSFFLTAFLGSIQFLGPKLIGLILGFFGSMFTLFLEEKSVMLAFLILKL